MLFFIVLTAGKGTLSTCSDVESIEVTTGELIQSSYNLAEQKEKNTRDPPMHSNQNILKYVVYYCTDYRKGNGINLF